MYCLLSCIAEVTLCLVLAFHLTEPHVMQEVKKQNVSFLHNRIAFTEKLPREEVRSKVAIVCVKYHHADETNGLLEFGGTSSSC